MAMIRNQLGIHCGNTDKVRSVLHKTYNTLKGHHKKVLTEEDLGGINLERISRPNTSQFKIEPGSKYEIMACKLIEEGNRERFVADLVSIEMLNDGLNKSVSRQAVKSMMLRLNPIENVVKTIGQWSDLHEGWVIARYNFTLHLLVRMNETYNHPSVQKHLKTFGDKPPDWLNREKLEEDGYTFSIKQVAWFDECHVYQRIGPDSPIQYRFKWVDGKPIPNLTDDYDDLCAESHDILVPANKRGPAPTIQQPTNDTNNGPTECDDDEICDDDEDTQGWHLTSNDTSQYYGKEQKRIKFKFQAQARFMFGVTMTEKLDGTVTGERLHMHVYSGKKILGMGKWNEGVRLAIQDAKRSNSRTWLTKRNRPLGKDLYLNDPISILPDIGPTRKSALNECGIFYVRDAVEHPEYIDNICASKAKITTIKRIISEGLAGK